MASELLLIDPHGGHSLVDDGLSTQSDMVLSARRAGVIPACTPHNRCAGGEYLDAMDRLGMGEQTMVGVEFEFHQETSGTLDVYDSNTQSDSPVRISSGPEVFLKNSLPAGFRARRYRREDLTASRERIKSCIEDYIKELGVNISSIAENRMDWLYKTVKWIRIFGGDLGFSSARAVLGLAEAYRNPEFATFYLEATQQKETPWEEQAKVAENLQRMPEIQRIAFLGEQYHDWRTQNKLWKGNNKGEIIFLLPRNGCVITKMTQIADIWRTQGLYRAYSLENLLDLVMSVLTDDEYKSTVRHIPHPFSVDTAISWGKVVVGLKGDVNYSIPELIDPKIAKQVHTIEVYNAAHPGWLNRLSARFAELDLFRNKGKLGVSDSHHEAWVGAGGTAVEVEEPTTEGILEGLRRGHTIPISGLGRLSRTAVPFMMWIMLAPLTKRKGSFAPEWLIDNVIRSVIDIRKPFDRMRRIPWEQQIYDGWVY